MRHRKSRWGRSEKARHELRLKRLSAPITTADILTFTKHLVAVSVGVESECWFYVGSTKGTTLTIPTNRYGNKKFNGENVGPHQFAYCAAEAITLVELAGFDVHHAAEFGRCIGYRCCNPDHLEKVPSKQHRRSRGNADTLIRFQTKIVREVLGVPPSIRRPVEYHTVSGAGARTRCLGGIPFLIQGGVMEDVSAELADTIPA